MAKQKTGLSIDQTPQLKAQLQKREAEMLRDAGRDYQKHKALLGQTAKDMKKSVNEITSGPYGLPKTPAPNPGLKKLRENTVRQPSETERAMKAAMERIHATPARPKKTPTKPPKKTPKKPPKKVRKPSA